MCLPSSSNILFLSKPFILAHFPGCIPITNGPYYCCWPGFQKAHNPHYSLVSTWLYLEWITVQKWRAHLWSWDRKTTRLRSRSWGWKASGSWGEKVHFWSEPHLLLEASIRTMKEGRLLCSLPACSSLVNTSIPSLALKPTWDSNISRRPVETPSLVGLSSY